MNYLGTTDFIIKRNPVVFKMVASDDSHCCNGWQHNLDGLQQATSDSLYFVYNR